MLNVNSVTLNFIKQLTNKEKPKEIFVQKIAGLSFNLLKKKLFVNIVVKYFTKEKASQRRQ
jgi:hypothetical protein